MRKRTALFLGAALLAAAPTLGAAKVSEVDRIKRQVRKDSSGRFHTVKYAKYVIMTDVDEQFAAEAAVYMRKFYVAFRSFFRPRPKLKATPIVYFLKDQKSYQDLMTERGFKSLLKAGGAYVGRPDKSELFCWHRRPGTGFSTFRKSIVHHEGSHQLLTYILGARRIPIWFSEGVATFFESWEVDKTREWNLENLQKTHTQFGVIRRTFGTEEFHDLHYLVRLTSKTWIPDEFGPKTIVHYAEVQSFMTFLLASEKGRRFFGVIFKAIARGKDPSKMLSRRVIDNAQKAWYKDIERRIGGPKGAAP